MKFFIKIAFILCFSFNAKAQTKQVNHILSGKVLDASTHLPIEHATIMIENNKDSRLIIAGMADSIGSFVFHYKYDGVIKVIVRSTGYNDFIGDTMHVRLNQSDTVRTIYLSPSSSSLQTVEVVAHTPIIINRVDKIIYNVANDITSQGGNVIDVLRKVPQVSVDADGNVELQGDANIRFLINGKPSSIFGNSLTDALSSIPTSQIKSIEVMTTPGAKYDAQGTGGIINIILKDNKIRGINGNVNLATGTRVENGSFNLNIRQGNFGLNVFFDGHARLKAKTPYNQNRISSDSTSKATTNLDQTGYTNFARSGYQTGINADWDITKHDNFTTSFTYDYFGNHGIGMANQDSRTFDMNNNEISDLLSISNSDSRIHIGSFDWSIGYTKKFKKEGQQLDFLYSASDGNPYNSYSQSQRYLQETKPYSGTISNNPGRDKQTILSINYSHPINKDFTLSMGAKTTFQNISSTTAVENYLSSVDNYLPDSTQSYTLHYKQKIYAAYLSGTFSMLHYLDVIAGLRYEYTHLGIDYQNIQIPSYNTFVPSIILSHKIGENRMIKLAFTRRIERPEYGELNPFLNFSDPYNITTGNPMLKPEIGSNFELGYSRNFKDGGNIYIAAIERINSQDIKNFTTFYPAYTIGDSIYQNVSITTRRNTGHEYNSGLIITSSLHFGAFNLRENAMIFNRHIVADIDSIPIINSFNWRINLNASYNFPHSFILEAFGDFRSSFKNIQGNQPGQFIYTFAFRKEFDNKKMSIGFTTTNPFNKYINQVTTIQTNNYTSYYRRQLPLRSFGISFTYKFEKVDIKDVKTKSDEKNNMDDAN